jgi:general secretion pathway protein D
MANTRIKIKAAALVLVLPVLAIAENNDPMVASAEMADQLKARLAEGGNLKVAALVAGEADEGVALIDDGKGAQRLVRKGNTLSGLVDGIKVEAKVKSVTSSGVELETAAGSVFLSGRFTPLEKPTGKTGNLVRHLEAESVALGELIKLIADRTGVNISSSDAAAGKSVSIFLRNITVAAAVEEICRTAGLWFRGDGEIIRIMTMEEYAKNLASFREESMESFTLLYPNVVEVAGVIYGLYPDRTLLSLGEEDIQEDGENDLSRRFRRFRVLEENGGSQFMDVEAPGVTGSSGNSGSGTFSYSRGSVLSRMTQWDQLKHRRRFDYNPKADLLSQTDAKRIDEAIKSGNAENYEQIIGETQMAANIFVSISRKSNMLIVRTSDTKAMAEIRALVKRMDVPTPMVLMEVKVMELQLDDDYDATFEYNFHVKESTHTMGNNGALIANALQSAMSGVSPTFSFAVLNDDIEARIKLMQKDGRIKVLATPTLLTANNEVSRIFSGKEYPIVTGWTPGQTVVPENGMPITTAPTAQIERKDIGTMLLVTPNINADRTVTLHLLQENSELGGKATIPVPKSLDGGAETLNMDIDFIESRSLTGTFVAKDKMTILAGGLIRESEGQTYYRTPFLGSVPLIGWLFRGTEKAKTRSELVVLITPHVITTPYEGGKISEELLKALSAHPARDGSRSLGTLRKGKDGVAAEHTMTNDLFNVIK